VLFAVRPDSPVPIYEQITAQIVFRIAAGDLSPGELVPSVRDLAHRMVVNPNTVARAYQDLERLGVLEAKRGRGMEVTLDGPLVCDQLRRDIVRERLRDVLRVAVAGALTVEEVQELVEQEWTKVNGRSKRRS
jgi:GntR family transcriptional regulator